MGYKIGTDLETLTTPALGDKIPVVDISDTTQSADGSTKVSTLQVIKDLIFGYITNIYATLTGIETLTNKTLTSPVITNKTSTGTDSGTETLTNKDLSSVTNTYRTSFPLNLAEGQMINGKIVVTVDGSGNMIVALKGMDGNDPSATNPVYVRIDGVVRSVTGALIVGATAPVNWLNLGSAGLATKETDLFVYLYWDATNSQVLIGFSRIPYATVMGDFTDYVGDGTEKAIRTLAQAATTTWQCVNIGRFAATLSAGAGYTWSVPTFTATNLIQRPIYETRWLTWVPTFTGSASMTYTSVTGNYVYQLSGRILRYSMYSTGTVGGTPDTGLRWTPPMLPTYTTARYIAGGCECLDNGVDLVAIYIFNSTSFEVKKYNSANWTAGANEIISSTNFYEI